MANEIYLYGMILKTNSFLLDGDFPAPDTYAEIKEKYSLPGGETGTCATVLAALGRQIRMDGTFMGRVTMPFMREFYAGKGVDLDSLHEDDTFDGLEDNVIIDKHTRTPFGEFRSFYASPLRRWNAPKEHDIAMAKVCGIDPYFMEQTDQAVKLCVKHKKPYVTIDCAFDSPTHIHSAINVVSNEFYGENYKQEERDAILQKYMDSSDGLTIFTLGSKEIRFGRKGGPIQSFAPYKVDVVSTLGAGDTFKAGCVYALWAGMSDEETVRFAAACAAVACTHFPLPLHPPTLKEVKALMARG